MNIKSFSTLLLSVSLFACGGGGGGSGGGSSDGAVVNQTSGSNGVNDTVEVITPAVDYSPDEDRKNISAETSKDLYVEESFSFNYSNKVVLSVSANDMEGDPLQGGVISVYSIPASINEWSDDLRDQAMLVSKGSTDSLGRFERELELFTSDKQLLVTLNSIGIETKALVPVVSGNVEYRFQ